MKTQKSSLFSETLDAEIFKLTQNLLVWDVLKEAKLSEQKSWASLKFSNFFSSKNVGIIFPSARKQLYANLLSTFHR